MQRIDFRIRPEEKEYNFHLAVSIQREQKEKLWAENGKWNEGLCLMSE